MKNLSLLLLSLFLFTTSKAQKEDKPTVVALTFGASLSAFVSVDTGNIVNASHYQPGSFSRSGTPVFLASIDHKLERKFSVGGSFSYQSFNLRATDTLDRFEAETGNVNRIHFAGRGLWHYGKKEKVDLYSGFKLGYLIQTVSKHQGTAYYNAIDNLGRSTLTLGLIPLGIRWFVSDDFGVNFETSLGRASFVQIGANYRW